MSIKTVVILILSVLLISLSFGVGYLIAKEANPAPIIIEKCSEN